MSQHECGDHGPVKAGMPTCQQCIDFLDDYVEGRLPADQAAVFEVHLERCLPCKEYVWQYKATIAAAKGCVKPCEENPPTQEVGEKLVRAIVDAMKRGKG